MAVLFINRLYFIENYFTSVSALALRPSSAKIEIATPAALEHTFLRTAHFSINVQKNKSEKKSTA